MFEWITAFVDENGYVGIALLMLLENVFPPIPSELIMPLAGYTAAQGQLHILMVSSPVRLARLWGRSFGTASTAGWAASAFNALPAVTADG